MIVEGPGQEFHDSGGTKNCWRQRTECVERSEECRNQEGAMHDRAHHTKRKRALWNNAI